MKVAIVSLSLACAACAFQVAPVPRTAGASATASKMMSLGGDENYFENEVEVMPSSPADAVNIDISDAAADISAFVDETAEEPVATSKLDLSKVAKVTEGAVTSGLLAVDKAAKFAAEKELGAKAKATMEAVVEWEKENEVSSKARGAIDAIAQFEKENEVALKAQAVFALAFGALSSQAEKMSQPAAKPAAASPKKGAASKKAGKSPPGKSKMKAEAPKPAFQMPKFF